MARDIAEIRNDIHHTRERLRVTAEAIGWKADVPARARDVLRETVAVVRERVNDGSTAPPLRREGDGGGPGLGERIGRMASAVGEGATSVKDRVQHGAEAVGERASSLKEGARDAAGRVAGTASSAREGAAHAADAVGERAAAARDATLHGAHEVGDRMPSRDDARAAGRGTLARAAENPIGVAVGALALGALAGALLPATRTEQERVAPVAQELGARGQELADEALARGREMAEQGREAAESAASGMSDGR